MGCTPKPSEAEFNQAFSGAGTPAIHYINIAMGCTPKPSKAEFNEGFSEAFTPAIRYIDTVKRIIQRCQLYGKLQKNAEPIHEGIPSELNISDDTSSTCSAHSTQSGNVDAVWWEVFIWSLPNTISASVREFYTSHHNWIGYLDDESVFNAHQQKANILLKSLGDSCRSASPPRQSPTRPSNQSTSPTIPSPTRPSSRFTSPPSQSPTRPSSRFTSPPSQSPTRPSKQPTSSPSQSPTTKPVQKAAPSGTEARSNNPFGIFDWALELLRPIMGYRKNCLFGY